MCVSGSLRRDYVEILLLACPSPPVTGLSFSRDERLHSAVEPLSNLSRKISEFPQKSLNLTIETLLILSTGYIGRNKNMNIFDSVNLFYNQVGN